MTRAEAERRVIDPLLEECSEAAHNEWLAEKQRRGVTTWPNERGFEQMVPYADCPEDVKEFDRIVVGAIMGVLRAKGLALPDTGEAGGWRPEIAGFNIGAGSVREGDTALYEGQKCKVLTVYHDGDVQIEIPTYKTVKWRFVSPLPAPPNTGEG